MSLQQTVQSRSSANGFGCRRNDREPGPRLDSKLQTGKTNSNRLISVGKDGGYESPSRERLVYLTTCLLGHHVEVQVLDGSVFSGIFHATNAEKDFGIILKMARLIKDGSRGNKNNSDSVSKPPSKTLIIPAKELVQVIGKGVPVTRDGLTNELLHEKQHELLIDSYISQSRHVGVEKELGRWVPDNNDPGCPELEHIFDGAWNRGWDQFEVNEALFGVKSTFNEELYTTKVERGPQMRELEKEAVRIAREIEGEETSDLHVADERGFQLHEDLEIDEETRYSSVFRKVDDSGYDDSEDILLDTCNDETFAGVSHSVIGKPITDLSSGKTDNGAQVPQRSVSMDEVQTSQSSTSREMNHSDSADTFGQLSVEHLPRNVLDDIRFQENHYTKDDVEKQKLPDEDYTSKPDDTWSTQRLEKESTDKGGLSANATAYAPSHVSSKSEEDTGSSNEPLEDVVSSKAQGTAQSSNTPAQTSTSASFTTDRRGAPSTSSAPGLSPSSSVDSLSSEKSTLNLHAKEFKLNPNAKSFIPSQTPMMRPASPVSDGSFYYPANLAAVPHMHGMPVGIGIGPSYSANQPVIFNPQAAQTTQPYFPPNGPQMMFGHPRQFVYMPTYPSEMPYKGREF